MLLLLETVAYRLARRC